MRLIFIRHAEPDYSIDSLTEKGWREAKLLAERTKRWKVDEFYCSPLGRAKDTASFTLKECGREAVTCDWMREFDACVVDPETGKNRLSWDLKPAYWTKEPDLLNIDRFLETDLMKSRSGCRDLSESLRWLRRHPRKTRLSQGGTLISHEAA